MTTDGLCQSWDDAARWALDRAELLAGPAFLIRAAADGVFTQGDVGYYLRHDGSTLALYPREATDVDMALTKGAAQAALPGLLDVRSLTVDDLDGSWIKVAHSPVLRRAGELLNFFPGHYPGGIPNAPSPLAATLTGSLVGAGLGYGAGRVAETLMPQSFENGRLRRALTLMGGAAGAAPGAAWGYSAMGRGNSLLDGDDLAPHADADPELSSRFAEKVADCDLSLFTDWFREAIVKTAASVTGFGAELVATPPSVLDVHVDSLGRTLWDVGADPSLTGTTLATLQTAARLPGGNGGGLVTPRQLGNFAAMAGAGYATGAAVGAVLGGLTGLPASAQTALRRTGAFTGIVAAVLPLLYGHP